MGRTGDGAGKSFFAFETMGSKRLKNIILYGIFLVLSVKPVISLGVSMGVHIKRNGRRIRR